MKDSAGVSFHLCAGHPALVKQHNKVRLSFSHSSHSWHRNFEEYGVCRGCMCWGCLLEESKCYSEEYHKRVTAATERRDTCLMQAECSFYCRCTHIFIQIRRRRVLNWLVKFQTRHSLIG